MMRSAFATCKFSIIFPSSWTTPFPWLVASVNAAMTRRAWSTSDSVGAQTTFAVSSFHISTGDSRCAVDVDFTHPCTQYMAQRPAPECLHFTYRQASKGDDHSRSVPCVSQHHRLAGTPYLLPKFRQGCRSPQQFLGSALLYHQNSDKRCRERT